MKVCVGHRHLACRFKSNRVLRFRGNTGDCGVVGTGGCCSQGDKPDEHLKGKEERYGLGLILSIMLSVESRVASCGGRQPPGK